MRITLLLLSLLISQNIQANTLKLNYSLFFGYMKSIYQLDYPDVTTAFYLLESSSGSPCVLAQAEMVVDNQREAIDFLPQGRLLPFYSDQHRKDGANIEVQTVSAEHCALQVTPMVKEAKLSQLTFARLTSMSSQLEGVLRKNAGLIGRYFLPTYHGVRLKLAQPLSNNKLTNGYQLASNGDLLISNQQLLASKGETPFPYQALRITAWIAD